MEEGSLRCDANISLRPVGQQAFGQKAELKNMNSFRNVQKGLEYEVQRQAEILSSGGTVVQETRRFDEATQTTVSMRSKEEAHDYRYFPEPDLVRLHVDDEWLNRIRASLPELPLQKRDRYMKELQLPAYDAGVLTASRELAAYYEDVVRAVPREPKLAANWVMGELAAALNKDNLDVTCGKLPAARLAGLLARISDQTISGKIAKEVFETMWADGSSADAVIEGKGLRQITDSSAIERVIDEVLARNPGQLAEYRSGKDKLFGFFVGQVMRATGGKANPAQLNELLKKKLSG